MGNPVYQIIANYQYASPSVPNEGALRIMTFDRSTRTVSVTTYSPTHDAFKTDPNSQFTLTEVGFFPSGPALTITDAATPEGATGAPTITFEVSLEPQ